MFPNITSEYTNNVLIETASHCDVGKWSVHVLH